MTPVRGQRWTAGRKEALLDALRAGRLAREVAIAEHALSEEELDSWERRRKAHGRPGLALRQLQRLRA